MNDIKRQLQGIDLVLTHKISGQQYYVDEKAQLDYMNEDLPTFAFELRYLKNDKKQEGWLYDIHKITDFYFLVTSIYSDKPDKFTSCKITIANRKMLFSLLKVNTISKKSLDKLINNFPDHDAKMEIEGLHAKNEGYLYLSNNTKAEKPVNLILKLDYLIEKGIAKRLV